MHREGDLHPSGTARKPRLSGSGIRVDSPGTVSSHRPPESLDANRVIRSQGEEVDPPDPLPTAAAGLAEAADRLDPAEDLLHPLPPAEIVLRIPHGPLAHRARTARVVLHHVRIGQREANSPDKGGTE